MSISQLFILSLRGDTIIFRDFLHDSYKRANEEFFQKVNFFGLEEESTPIFNINGINFIYMKKNELYIVLTSKDNVSSNYFLEIINRLVQLIKDYCGIMSEEAIRKNFVLIYEIIDEMIDFGYPQLSLTEHIKPFIYTEPIMMIKSENAFEKMMHKGTAKSESAQKPISQVNEKKNQKNEIFVDIIEKLTVLINSSGNLINCGVDGCIKMKSYLKGNPELKVLLNDEISIGQSSSGSFIEDYNFHSKVNAREFESNRTLYIAPPDGEFIAMNYRINSYFSPPFKIYSYIEESNYKLELKLRLSTNFSDKYFAGNVVLKFQVPKSSQNVHFDLPKNKLGQKIDYIQSDKVCIWHIPKFQGGLEHNLVTKITIQNNNPKECRKELGPITMTFEIPTYNISKLQIKELKILTNEKDYKPNRWVRSVTQANSYVIRIA